MLLISKSSLSALISWEFLGVSRFFLVIYYGRSSSAIDAIVIGLTMRLGDFFLIASLTLVTSAYSNLYVGAFVLFFILAAITKRAQYPFMG